MALASQWKRLRGRLFRLPRPLGRRAEPIRRIKLRELVSGQRRYPAASVGRPLERLVMMDDYDTVPRQVHVELEAVGAKRKAVIERGDGVFRPERRSTPVGVHERSRRACGRQFTNSIWFTL
jgi:hypothetical protein